MVNNRGKLRLSSWCRPCEKAYAVEYRAANREALRVAQARRYERDPVYYIQIARAWQQRNREAFLAAKRQRRRERPPDPEVSRAQKRRYYEANRERIKQATRTYALTHPESATESKRRHKALKKSQAIGVITPGLLAGKLAYWGWRCWIAGLACKVEPDHWDHVKPLTKGGAHVLANLRPACGPCNMSKRNRWPYPTRRRRV